MARSWLIPRDASPDARRLVLARGMRGFVDGMVSVLLASYLSDLGFSPGQIGVLIARNQGWDLIDAQRSGFLLYSIVAVVIALMYRRLSPSIDPPPRPAATPALEKSRDIVLRLSALFSLDAFGGGFVVQSMLAL